MDKARTLIRFYKIAPTNASGKLTHALLLVSWYLRTFKAVQWFNVITFTKIKLGLQA